MNNSEGKIKHFLKFGDKCDCQDCELIRELAKEKWG